MLAPKHPIIVQAYIITIGDEILIGQVTDTNATYMAAALTEKGVDVVEHLSVSDDRAAIIGAIDRAFAAADLVLMTGGLGPTKDDITKSVLADYFATSLVFHEKSWERLQRIFRDFGREPQASHRVQCYMPLSAEILTNKMGTAPGMLLKRDGKTLISMPGVPYEMSYLVDNEVIPRIDDWQKQGKIQKLRSVTMLTAGAGESMIAEMIEDVEEELPKNMSLAYLPNLGTVRLRLSVRGEDEEKMASQLNHYQTRIETIISDLIYGYGKQNLAAVLGELLNQNQLTLGTVESCTGGKIAQMLTNNAGSSAYYQGSIIAYDNEVKKNLLAVKQETLVEHGAVSEQTVREMVAGGLQTLGTDIVVATSGIAGPGGGTPEKPVGTIWVAVGNSKQIHAELLNVGKDRERNITYSTLRALNIVRQFVLDMLPHNELI